MLKLKILSRLFYVLTIYNLRHPISTAGGAEATPMLLIPLMSSSEQDEALPPLPATGNDDSSDICL